MDKSKQEINASLNAITELQKFRVKQEERQLQFEATLNNIVPTQGFTQNKMNRGANVPLATFSGLNGEDFEKFLKQFELACCQ